MPEEPLAPLLAVVRQPEDLIGENGMLSRSSQWGSSAMRVSSKPKAVHLSADKQVPVPDLGNNHPCSSKNRDSFMNDEAWMKLFYLALQNISQKWTIPIQTGGAY